MALLGNSAPPGWYVVQTSLGGVGLVLHRAAGAFKLGASNGTVVQAVNVGSSKETISQLLSPGTQVQSALVGLGASSKQTSEYIAQVSENANLFGQTGVGGIAGDLDSVFGVQPTTGQQASQLLFPTSGQPVVSAGTSPLSSTLTGSALGTDVNAPSVGLNVGDVLSNIWTFLTTPSKWVRILEFVGGAVLVYMAVKGLTGIDTPSVTEVASKVVK